MQGKVWGNNAREKAVLADIKTGIGMKMLIQNHSTSRAVILKIYDKFGITYTPRRKRRSAEAVKAVIKMDKNGISCSKIAAELDLPLSTVYNICSTKGLPKTDRIVGIGQEGETRAVRCKCPYCKKEYTLHAFYLGSEPWYKYCPSNCQGLFLSKRTYSGQQPTQKNQSAG